MCCCVVEEIGIFPNIDVDGLIYARGIVFWENG
jgi:hypothetical protein